MINKTSFKMSNLLGLASKTFYRLVLTRQVVSKSDFCVWPFMVLSLFIFCNFNGILSSIFGVGGLGSPIILFCSFLIFRLIDVKISWFNKYYYAIVLFLIAFLSLGWLSLFWNYLDPYVTVAQGARSTREFITVVIIISAFYIYARYRTLTSGRDTALFDVFIFFVIALLAGVFEEFLGLRSSLYVNADPNRALGFFGNPNETGFQANLTLILAMYFYIRKRIGLIVFGVMLGICSYGAILSFSKTAIITLGFLLVAFILYLTFSFLRPKSSFRKQSFGFISLLILVVSVSLNLIILPMYNELSPGQAKRIKQVGELVLEGKFNRKTTSARSGVFQDAYYRILDKPFLGYGLSAFTRGGLFASSPSHGVHNMYLRIAGEGGVLLLIFFMGLLTFYMYSGLFVVKKEIGFIFFLFIFSIALYAIASHSLFNKKFVFGLFGVFLAVIGRTVNDDSVSH